MGLMFIPCEHAAVLETFKKPSHLIYVKNYIGLKITCMVLLKSGKSFVRKMRVGSLSRKSPFFGV